MALKSPAVDFPTPGILSNELASIFFFTHRSGTYFFQRGANLMHQVKNFAFQRFIPWATILS